MNTSAPTLVSVVVPVLDEADNIRRLYSELRRVEVQAGAGYDWEFIFTDNHSSDESFEILMQLAHADNRVRAYRFSRDFGFQRSILTGYRLARGDVAVQLDCDLQDPPDLIVEFLRLWREGNAVVYGIRRSRAESWALETSRRLFYRLISWLSGRSLPRNAGDFRLIDGRIIDLLRGYDDIKPYVRGYIAGLGFKQIGVAYDRDERRGGRSKFNWKKLVGLALDGILSHSILPLRVASITGCIVFIAAVLATITYLVARISAGGDVWPEGFATLAIMMSFSLALNAIFLGIIGEYIARIFLQVKNAPLSIIEAYVDSTVPSDTLPDVTSGASRSHRNRIIVSTQKLKTPSSQT